MKGISFKDPFLGGRKGLFTGMESKNHRTGSHRPQTLRNENLIFYFFLLQILIKAPHFTTVSLLTKG